MAQSASMQQVPAAMHLPLQSRWPAGQAYLHVRLTVSQLATRPLCAGQSPSTQQAPQRSPQALGMPLPGSQTPPSEAGVAPGASTTGPAPPVPDVPPCVGASTPAAPLAPPEPGPGASLPLLGRTSLPAASSS